MMTCEIGSRLSPKIKQMAAGLYILASILFALVISVTAVQSQIQSGPVNALKKVGDNVTLDCVTSSNNCDGVEWVKMEGAQSPRKVYRDGIIINTFPSERYSVNSAGGCSLTITQLEVSDSGRFSCVLHVGDKEETRSSVLVVINATESCLSNVTNNALNQNDVYSFWTAINVPDKSVEPSDVTLSFENKVVGETETTDESHPLIVKTTLNGIARKVNITQHVCTASFPPNTADGFDRSTATLVVCITQPLFMSYPVENVTVSPSGPYRKGATVRCTADGYPYPTFKWTHLESGQAVASDTLEINGEAGDEYSCTATNTVNGKTTSQNMTIVVIADPGCGRGCIAAILVVLTIIIVLVVIWLGGWKRKRWHLWFCFPCLLKKDDESRDIENADIPLAENVPPQWACIASKSKS